jgi:transglutaminase-like putative cysteine protease
MGAPGSIVPRPARFCSPIARTAALDDESPRRKGRYISYAVYLSDLAQDALFFAGTPQYLRIDSMVVRRPFGNYSAQFSEARTVSYQVYSRLDSPPAADPALVEPLPPMPRSLPAIAAPGPAHPRADGEHRWRRSVARRPGPHAREISARQLWLHAGTSQVEPDDPLAFFLFHRRKGHCEYFASSMAVMLRVLQSRRASSPASKAEFTTRSAARN